MRPKRALVTGAANGIGRSIATFLAGKGVEVMALDIDELRLADLNHETGCSTLNLNLTEPGAASKCLEACWPIDFLVNNAAIITRSSLVETSDDAWDDLMDLNLKAPFQVIRECASRWIADKTPGHVVNISSGHAILAGLNRLPYAAAKAGLEALTRNAALELGKFGILVNAVAPGFTFTEMSRQSLVGSRLAAVEERLPIHRVAEPEEVAAAVWALLDGQLSYMTGQVLRLDGGWSNSDIDYSKLVP